MCGIAGVFLMEGNPRSVDAAALTRMRDTMIHRGPDGGATWVSPDRRVGLAFRRLAIIDLSDTAMQPMSNEDDSLRVLFNGEIYNHAEIRSELERSGSHHWKTDHSDTEVILHAFEEWGIDFLGRLRGMFAIALWDAKKRELWLVRDRIGVKPLYYSLQGNKITFASEIKAILQDGEQKRAVHEEALYHYLSFLTTPAPQTLFDGILKLPGGCWLKISADGQMRQERYWDAWDHVNPLTEQTDEEIAARLLDELRTSVKLRKVSDVPVGVFLSGGIDSSTNTVLFSEDESKPVEAFTIGYQGEYQTYKNEVQYARRAAALVGADYHQLLLTQKDLLDFLPQMVHLQDEPIADPVCVPVYYVSRLARQNGVIVCQVGEGADELFWGYPGWKQLLRLQQMGNWPVPTLLKQALAGILGGMGKSQSFPYEYLRRNVHGQPVFWGGAEAFSDRQKQTLLTPRLRKKFDGYTSWEAIAPIYERFVAKAWEPSPLQWMTYLDINLRLPELLLMRVDKMSMGVSLEGRVPFLDHKFVEFALGIPAAVKTRNGQLKYILKKAVRGLLPDDLIERPKQGFGVPVYEWFFEDLGQQAWAEVSAFCKETDLLAWDSVEWYFHHGYGSQVWFLFNLALWWKTYIKN